MPAAEQDVEGERPGLQCWAALLQHCTRETAAWCGKGQHGGRGLLSWGRGALGLQVPHTTLPLGGDTNQQLALEKDSKQYLSDVFACTL